MGNLVDKIKSVFNNNPFQVIGVLGGFLLSLFILLFGFFQTLFIFLVMGIGYVFGFSKDKNRDLSEVVQSLKGFFKGNGNKE